MYLENHSYNDNKDSKHSLMLRKAIHMGPSGITTVSVSLIAMIPLPVMHIPLKSSSPYPA